MPRVSLKERLCHDSNCPMREEKKLGIIGFGNQAKAWALNLKDSGWKISIILRPKSKNIESAHKLGFQVILINDPLIKELKNFALLIPDHEHLKALEELRSMINPQSRMIYAHGYSMGKNHLQSKFPQIIHLLLAPKSIASEMRFFYETGKKISGVYSTEFSFHPKEDETFLFDLSHDLGLTVGPFKSQFHEECKADLFSEQALLCGLYPYAILEAYNLLRKNNVSPELAYLECWHESKLIIDAMIQKGPKDFFELISPNALIGSQKGFELMKNDLKNNFEILLSEINNLKFDEEVNQIDINQLKQKVSNFWESQELQQTYNQLKELYT
jgi:ketol-acid reductoisomerase